MAAQDETVPRLLHRVRGNYRKASPCISYRPGEEPAVYTPKPKQARKPAAGQGLPQRNNKDYYPRGRGLL